MPHISNRLNFNSQRLRAQCEKKARSACHVPHEDIHNFLFEQMTCVIGAKEILSNISFCRENAVASYQRYTVDIYRYSVGTL